MIHCCDCGESLVLFGSVNSSSAFLRILLLGNAPCQKVHAQSMCQHDMCHACLASLSVREAALVMFLDVLTCVLKSYARQMDCFGLATTFESVARQDLIIRECNQGLGALFACRIAFLQKAFLEEFEPGKKSQAMRSSAQQSGAEAVRPGGFLSCVTASKAEMLSMQGVEPTIQKLEVIRQEALKVLESIAA